MLKELIKGKIFTITQYEDTEKNTISIIKVVTFKRETSNNANDIVVLSHSVNYLLMFIWDNGILI